MSILDQEPQAASEPRPSPPGPATDVEPGRMEPLNLARRPFLNSRPVVRISLLLWLLGTLLLLGNVSLFWSYLSGSADKRRQIARGEVEIERQQQATEKLQSRLKNIDLVGLNEQVDFLNEKIDERTFSWSLLLDRLVEVLPNDVRLTRLAPSAGKAGRQGAGRSQPAVKNQRREGQVPLTITGETRSDEALLRLVDNLFEHPAFVDPNLTHEERQEDNLVTFELTVQYIPGGPPRGVVVEETPKVEETAPRRSAPGGPP